MADMIIALPAVTTSVSIKSDWIQVRDELVFVAGKIESIANEQQMEAAGDLLGKITKASNTLEKFRKDIAEPFQDATKRIKEASDKAREPLETVKAKLKNLMAQYEEARRRREAEERKRIEEEQRKQIEAQAAKHAEMVAAGLIDEEEPLAPPPVVEVPAVVETKAKGIQVTERVVFEVIDEEKVPREFLVVDESRIRKWAALNDERIKKRLKQSPVDAEAMLAGVRFAVKTEVKSH